MAFLFLADSNLATAQSIIKDRKNFSAFLLLYDRNIARSSLRFLALRIAEIHFKIKITELVRVRFYHSISCSRLRKVSVLKKSKIEISSPSHILSKSGEKKYYLLSFQILSKYSFRTKIRSVFFYSPAKEDLSFFCPHLMGYGICGWIFIIY